MLGALKKKQTTTSAKPAASKVGSTDARPFLPQFSHFDRFSIVTKDGGIMQTICIAENASGLNYEQHDRSGGNLRDCIRKAIGTHVATDSIAVWVHTLRKRRAISFAATYDNAFAAHTNQSWRAKNGWSHQYYNEVYVTLLYDGQSAALTDKDLFKKCATPQKNRDVRNTYLESAAEELSLMMEGIIDDLSANYRISRLGIVTRGASNIAYSEPMEFLSYLLNLREEEVRLPDADISAALQSCDLVFGFNAMETKSEEGAKRFGALLSLKQYREVPLHTVDMLLQAPMELIITQAFHFIPSDVALKEYREQKDYYDVSGDDYSMQSSGLAEMLMVNKGFPTDFGTQQTNIMVVVDELKRIDEDISHLQKAFSALGLVCIREDIRLEEIFWSMFPGNFIFLRRKTAIPAMRLGGFAKLNRFSTGHYENLHWKQPVSLVPTLVNSPYAFNFHVGDNGHTLLLDFNSFNDSMAILALSFLLMQTQKLHPRMVYFDHHAKASLWFDKMGAHYHMLRSSSAVNGLTLNPFSLPDDTRNTAFLTAWCSELIDATEAERAQIKTAIEALYRTTSRNLFEFVQILGKSLPTLGIRFAPWLANGQHGGLFSASGDDITITKDWLGIDLTEAFGTPQNAVAAFSYLLHRVILSLDGTPTIIVLQHALPLLEQAFFSARLSSLLEMLSENNAILISCARYSEHFRNSPVAPILIEHCATKIIAPDDLDMQYSSLLPSLFSINDDDVLEMMKRMQGDILVMQGGEVTAIRINLDHMPDVSTIFDNDIKNLMSAGGPFAIIPKVSGHG